MSRRIAVIIGHPDSQSLCHALAAAYIRGAEASGAQVSVLDLASLAFEPSLRYGYRKRTELEPDLLHAQQTLLKADHTVWIFPIWWASMPAVLKGFLDRALLPGFAFRYDDSKPVPVKLLGGRSGRIIATMDSPTWYYRTLLRDAGITVMKKGVLEFCGIRPVGVTRFGSIRGSSDERRAKMLAQAEQLGRAQK
ncbi:NAD(P)H dehydrogenase (quinone) [Paenibacillus pasadenensis]|uniref:NAD(P)H dehydrogenase (Quinone) n=1 Tax=Paenibacillus pasadenensis TaxID=217090 RepID=A0A2N5NCY3_9BACL|nr:MULTISPECIES: NAD(P)H-dependent oxidoreductase [Paenibacillus]PLT48168.1 NAD(P)H dehydrogenase (quinone) [Paenibacillus pasadenensis]QGG58318.1 flavodoxin family protein [Paenibacillus sp. B01]